MGKYPMAQATLSCPFGAIHLEDRRGTAQGERFALIFALPPAPHNGGRVPAGFCRITGAQNLSGALNPSRATSSSRISYPSLRPAGQSSLTPSLLLSNANPLRWALRWGPPAAAYLGGKFQPVRVHWCAWLCQTNDTGLSPTVGAHIVRPPSLPSSRGKVPQCAHWGG